VKAGEQQPIEKVYDKGTIGDLYTQIMALRSAQRDADGNVWTKDQQKRDDWPRAWRHLAPVVGDFKPKQVTPAVLLSLRTMVAQKFSETEAHRVIKVWRALYVRMMALIGESDPSLAFTNKQPDARNVFWIYDEVVQLVDRAVVEGKLGLAAMMAVAWDTMMSPIDVRTLKKSLLAYDDVGPYFKLERAKTGKAAAGTMTAWSQKILAQYLDALAAKGIELHDSTQIFWTMGWVPGAAGGRPRPPSPYLKRKAEEDFAEIRTLVFGADEARVLSDMRRSGAIEADAGGVTKEDLAHKMANSIDANKRLQKTYTPTNNPAVRRADEARVKGREALRASKAAKPETNVVAIGAKR